mgnify:CR=1 FL=1
MAAGFALAAKRRSLKFNSYALLSDGELDEGSNWEALMTASHFKLDMFLKKININKYKRYKNKYNFKASILKSKRVLKWEPKKDMKKELVKLI